jgi:nucleotide-binding universal stress UspA family protein
MALKNLLVHLDTGPRVAERLALAVRLAERHQARLTGVFGQLAEAHRVGVVADWPPAVYAEAAAISRTAFSSTSGSLRDAEWIDLNRGGEDEILHRLGVLAAYFDMMVVGQHDESARRIVPSDLASHVCNASGRPVLVVPYAGHFPDVGRRPMFAWSESASAARALEDGLTLVTPDADALVLYAYEREQRSEFAERAVKHLESHGIAAQFEPFALEDETTMDVLLNFASDHGADLMTLGLGGHAGLSLFDRGRPKPTLRELTVPVLCAC